MNEVITETQAATSETKYRLLEVLTENWSLKAYRGENYAEFFLKNPQRNRNGCWPAVKVLTKLLDTAEDTRA